MPKLPASIRKEVNDATTMEYTLIEPGRYFATLSNVEVKDGKYGPQWSAEFDTITDAKGTKSPGRQWYNLNLPVDGHMPAAYLNGEDKWEKFQDVNRSKMKQFFQAFGYTSDSDTDEMIGETIAMDIEVRTIQSGNRTGERVNSVKNIHPHTALAGGKPEDAPF